MKQLKLTESQLKRLSESSLYGDNTDVVDYDLPEMYSDTIILSSLKDMSDVEKAIKELHKRLVSLETGNDSAGFKSSYATDTNYMDQNTKLQTIKKANEKDQEQDDHIEDLRTKIQKIIDK